jgi:hypothetical protein
MAIPSPPPPPDQQNRKRSKEIKKIPNKKQQSIASSGSFLNKKGVVVKDATPACLQNQQPTTQPATQIKD